MIMEKPKKEDFGWVEPSLYEEGGWCFEGGEERYIKALEEYNKGLYERYITMYKEEEE